MVQVRARLSVLIALAALSLAGGAAAGQGEITAAAPRASAVQPALIDINSASRGQLKTLPGIGDADAERIVAGRPYLSKASLVSEKIIPAGVYQAIRHRIIAIQKTMPRRPAIPARPAGSTG